MLESVIELLKYQLQAHPLSSFQRRSESSHFLCIWYISQVRGGAAQWFWDGKREVYSLYWTSTDGGQVSWALLWDSVFACPLRVCIVLLNNYWCVYASFHLQKIAKFTSGNTAVVFLNLGRKGNMFLLNETNYFFYTFVHVQWWLLWKWDVPIN